ncbi:hypothetical protein O181_001400 [Austropuccinia psidii MF-1]|uniref:Integrase catalytic domain-containing protein n=1 Tax=Austropuccinia psidii MF-1 TaxID=1389203 RepID=A0A9Q3BAX0_9BASI|nr:hypothetical protein [Austropuccinia psidii MF-1]
MPELKDVTYDDMDIVMQADKQAEIFQRFISLAEKIRPQLRADGANFNLWSKSMINAWTTYFMGDADYFHQTGVDGNVKRNLVARLFIEHSVNSGIYESITSRISVYDARKIFQALKDRFNRPSWSSVIYHAGIIFRNSSDRSDTIGDYAMTITEAVQNLENQVGQIDSEMLTTLAIYFAVPSMHQIITPAINTLMATNPNLKVRPDDLLNMIRQISTASPSFDHSTEIARLNAVSKFGRREPLNASTSSSSRKPTYGNTKASSSNRPSGSRAPNPRSPCHYCGEIGHWSPTCPIKAKAFEIRFKGRQQSANVASMGVVPLLEDNEALLDSGAMHSVVGNLSLFTSLSTADMMLSVASSESFQVDGIGTIKLHTPYGLLQLNNVLYCRNIPGVLLSLGHLLNEGFSISFLDNYFTVSSRFLNFSTIKRNNCWFIPLSPSTKTTVDTSPSSILSVMKSIDSAMNNDSLLWHRRIAHLSLRHLRRMQKSSIVNGIPNVPFHDIKLCHDCSISKSQHRPVKTTSRRSIKQPGDLIVADLMGPYELSLNHKKYVLMIQDAFSRVVVAIALSDKSESKSHLINWMKQFMNVTSHKIKTVRTDNGTEFKNSILNDFLIQNGIVHEYSMPYEHHQNGRIERTNRTISEMARTSLIAAKLPSFLWPWAFRHAVWVFNRYLHADSTLTPFEVLGKKRPSLELLRVFGAKSYIYNHKFKKDFSPRATIGYHLGVSEDSKGWLFWVPTRKDIIKSASVSFDESTFYDGKVISNHISSIQARDLFDSSMVTELNRQDESIDNALNNTGLHLSIPSNYGEAMTSVNKTDWISAIDEEIGSMMMEKVFTPFHLRDALREVPHESILGTKWVFTKKPDRFKARLVARGFRQIQGINYDETFAPTPTFNSLRLLFSTAFLNRWRVRTFDVKVAFLHSIIDKPVYVWPPIGMNIPKNKVLKLNKALYGTKQASRCWWLHLKNILQKIGFTNNKEDPSTYTFNRNGDQAILWVHVDDGALTASSDKLMDSLIQQLNSHLKVKWDDNVNSLVGISIKETKNGFKFWQPDLIDKLVNMIPSKIIAKTPLPSNCQLESNYSLGEMDKPYLRRIGILLYIAQGSRPDIAFAVNYLARFSLHMDKSHWAALEHLIAYLRGTRNMGIMIDKSNSSLEMKCYVDANWGGEGNRSTHGYIIFHGKNPIGWQSKRQITIASSTAQAEYMALSFAAKEMLWLYNLFFDILKNPIPTLYSDNRTAVGISTESMNRKQTRHLIRDFNTINEFIAVRKLKLEWISTNDQLADILTKSLGSIKHGLSESFLRFWKLSRKL